VNDSGKTKNLNIARLVAHNFVYGHSKEKNTVDHKDGDKSNNKASNLEWVTQSTNNQRAYDNGKKSHAGYSKRGKFQKIILDGKYEFKTIRALAKFLKVSESQVGRYIDGDCKTEHTFKIIY
jgi:predicted transcriptional regulator YheO